MPFKLTFKHLLQSTLLLLLLSMQYVALSEDRNYVVSQRVISIEDGLASREVFCTIQDDDGFLWFGTRNGLDRYDGKSVQHFTQQKNQLAGNRIIQLAKDKQNRLIILFGHPGYSRSVESIQVMDLKSHQLLTLKQAYPNLPMDQDYVYWVGNDGNDLCFLSSKPFQYWRLTNQGFQLKASMKSWDALFTNSEDWKTKYAPNHCMTGRQCLFAQGYATLYLDEKHAAYFVTPEAIIEKKFNTIHRPILITQDHHFIHDILDVTYKMDSLHNWKQVPALFPAPTFQKEANVYLTYSNHNELLITEKQAGVWMNDDQGLKKICSLEELNLSASDAVYHYYTDRQGIHWIATANGVLKLFVRKNPFNHYYTKQQLNDNNENQVRGIYADEQGHVFAHVWTRLFKGDLSKSVLHSEILYGITRHQGKIYSGSIYLSLLEKSSLKVIDSMHYNDELWTLDSLNEHELLIGTTHGILRYDVEEHKKNQVRTNALIPQPSFVYRFNRSMNHGLWAIAQNGMYKLTPQGDSVLQYIGSSSKNIPDILRKALSSILDAYIDEQGVFWIATNGLGLYSWRPDQNLIEQYTTANGLPSEILYRIESDGFNNLWISSDNGLLRFNKQDKRVLVYTKANGLSHNEFNRTSSFKAKDGTLYFGGIDGINAFKPESFAKDTLSLNAPIRIITFNQFSGKENVLKDETQSVLQTGKIILQPNDKFFNLEFQLLDYLDGSLRYAYKMEGLDADWNYIRENSIRISGLPSGHYTLRIKGQGPNGQWSEQQLVLPIQVLSPFYTKPWFIVAGIISSFVLIILVVRWRTKNLLISKQALERTVDNRTEQLKNSLQEKEMLLKEIHHRVKNNLEVISSLLELQSLGIQDPQAKAAIAAGQSRVHSIALIHHKLYQSDHISHLPIQSFIQELFLQVKQVFSSSDTQVALDVQGDDILLPLDVAVPLGLILNELMTNSFKYAVRKSEQHQFTIQLLKNMEGSTDYVLRYNDHGPGLKPTFKMETSTSLGMKIIQLLTKQIGGEFRIQTTEGTLFEIPFNKTRKNG